MYDAQYARAVSRPRKICGRRVLGLSEAVTVVEALVYVDLRLVGASGNDGNKFT